MIKEIEIKIKDYMEYKNDRLKNVYKAKVSCLKNSIIKLENYNGTQYKLKEMIILSNNIDMWNIEIIAIKRVARINKIKLNKDVK